jgi:hypothetical protein
LAPNRRQVSGGGGVLLTGGSPYSSISISLSPSFTYSYVYTHSFYSRARKDSNRNETHKIATYGGPKSCENAHVAFQTEKNWRAKRANDLCKMLVHCPPRWGCLPGAGRAVFTYKTAYKIATWRSAPGCYLTGCDYRMTLAAGLPSCYLTGCARLLSYRVAILPGATIGCDYPGDCRCFRRGRKCRSKALEPGACREMDTSAMRTSLSWPRPSLRISGGRARCPAPDAQHAGQACHASMQKHICIPMHAFKRMTRTVTRADTITHTHNLRELQ